MLETITVKAQAMSMVWAFKSTLPGQLVQIMYKKASSKRLQINHRSICISVVQELACRAVDGENLLVAA